MARSIHRAKIYLLAVLTTATPTLLSNNICTAIADATEDLTFQVDIDESITVSVTNPATWASGDVNNFLRNKVNVAATTNNGIGVTVSMYTNDTKLHNLDTYNASDATSYIPTLQNSFTVANFPTNYWGYSVDDTDSGSNSANYNALTTSATQLFTTVGTQTVSTGQKDVFFGAKANAQKQSGTYAQTVYFAAVTGAIDTDPNSPSYNPPIPVNPSTPEPSNQIAHYSTSTGRTTYTTRTTTGSGDSPITGTRETTSTAVTEGDTTSSYAQAAGVTSTSGNNGSNLATALAVSAAVAVASGTAFIILAKKRRDDDEEENQ